MPETSTTTRRIVILISGRGSNMQVLVEACRQQGWPASIAAVIASRPDAAGLEWAAAQGIATAALYHKDYASREAFDAALAAEIDLHAPDYVILAGFMRVLSVGGGDIRIEGRADIESPEVYVEHSFAEIARYCKDHNLRISDYVEQNEGPEIWDFLLDIWGTMQRAIQEGLTHSGILPGGLNVERKAQYLYNQRHIDERPETRENRIVCAYAFAVSEQNAGQGTVVTAPTCVACSTLPAVLKYMQEEKGFSDRDVLRALAVAGIVGNLVKTNASISGAECGCQAEIGTACSMASAALGELFGMGIDQIEYAAEVALEHHLGLTCDPIGGLVQIPCIERNAVAAMRAINAVRIANFLTATRKISFDMVVETMYQTGRDLNRIYRETAEGGLAKLYK